MLKNFAHIDTESVDEAAGLLREGLEAPGLSQAARICSAC